MASNDQLIIFLLCQTVVVASSLAVVDGL